MQFAPKNNKQSLIYNSRMVLQPQRLAIDQIRQLLPLKALTVIRHINIVKIRHHALIRIVTPMNIHPRVEECSHVIRSAGDILPVNF